MLRFLLISSLIISIACSGTSNDGEISEATTIITFNAVGSTFVSDFDLIDLEFLPGQGGELLVIGQGGIVYYVTSDFAPLEDSTETIDVLNSGEQGLLNVEADPDYDSNHFVYFFYTLADGSANQVDRYTVTYDAEGESFSLDDPQTIISFSKSDSPDPGDNHNGGGMAFDDDGRLLIGVGDGGGGASSDEDVAIGQDTTIRLGKILRIVPNRVEGEGGFSIPEGGNGCEVCTLPEIYAYGVRNPFTLFFGDGALFIGDVGADTYEEINLADEEALNFGWPLSEGPTSDSDFRTPLHGYAHDDDTFINEDEDATTEIALLRRHGGVDHGDSDKSIMVGAFYEGSEYGGLLNRRLIYADYYIGFIRGVALDADHTVTDDDHLGHETGITALQEGTDGFLYAVSLYGADQILRMELE